MQELAFEMHWNTYTKKSKMKTKIIIMICLLFATATYGQKDTIKINRNIINTIEGGLSFGQGAGNFGIFGKVNKYWLKKNNFILQSGLLLNTSYSSENLEYHQSVASGSTYEIRTQFHTGIQLSFFKRKRLFVFTEAYGGYYGIFTNGNYSNSQFDIDRNFSNTGFLWDYGSLMGFGYKFNDFWSGHININNSWKQVNNGTSFLAGFLVGQPDAKYFITVEIEYKMK